MKKVDKSPSSVIFATPKDKSVAAFTVADRYTPREIFTDIFGVPKLWPGKNWVHLVHNWRTGGSSLSALLSVNFHDSYLKVGHPFTRHGWPVDYGAQPLQITKAEQLIEWIKVQHSPAIVAGHTYSGMASSLGIQHAELWVTLRDPAARLNSGLLRFHRKAMRGDHPDGGYVGKTKGHTFHSASEIKSVCKDSLSHEINGMCRRIAGYDALSSNAIQASIDNLESCKELDQMPVDKACFEIAMDKLKSSKWIYLTEHVIPSLLLLEHTYGLRALIHPCSDLIHNPQWNGGGITRLQESLLTKHRPLLESLNKWDVKLYAEATKLFWNRWNIADIDVDRLKARRIIQSAPILMPNSLKDQASAKRKSEEALFKATNKTQDANVRKWIVKDLSTAMCWNMRTHDQ